MIAVIVKTNTHFPSTFYIVAAGIEPATPASPSALKTITSLINLYIFYKSFYLLSIQVRARYCTELIFD